MSHGQTACNGMLIVGICLSLDKTYYVLPGDPTPHGRFQEAFRATWLPHSEGDQAQIWHAYFFCQGVCLCQISSQLLKRGPYLLIEPKIFGSITPSVERKVPFEVGLLLSSMLNNITVHYRCFGNDKRRMLCPTALSRFRRFGSSGQWRRQGVKAPSPKGLKGARKGVLRGINDTVLDKFGCNFLVWEGRYTNLNNINPHRTPITQA